MIGQTISHYQILEKLGEGGMGVVYKAKDLKLERLVALKFLLSHLVKSDEEKQRFIREAQAASALDHANIGTIYEVEETKDGRMFIAMAYYEGDTLAKRIEKGPLPLNDAIEVAVQIAQGLARAHEAGIVHRDVKPANIVVTGRGEVKIVDFGLAKLAGAAKLTKSGVTVGTMGYLSPEQARGQEVDHRTDIWSLGVVLYEMISGGLPFKSDYPEATVYSILNETPQPLTGLRTGIPMDLERVVSKMMAKQVGERYQHLGDTIVDLRGLGKIGRPDSMSKRTLSTNRRKTLWRLLWASLIVVAALVIGYIRFESKPESDASTALDGINGNEPRPGVVSDSHRDTVLLTVRSDFDDLDPFNETPDPVDLARLQPSEVQSILDELLPRAISLLQPEHVVITHDDLERRMAGTGFQREDYRSRDVHFMIDTARCKLAVFIYAFRMASSSKDSLYRLTIDIHSYYENGYGSSESNCTGARQELLSCIEGEITGYLRSLITNQFVGKVLSVADDKILFSFNDKSFLRSGALLDLWRAYEGTEKGVQNRLRDINLEIDYLKKQPGGKKNTRFLEKENGRILNELERVRNKPGSIGNYGRSFEIAVKVTEVFDTTAIGVVFENNEPWFTVIPGDQLKSR